MYNVTLINKIIQPSLGAGLGENIGYVINYLVGRGASLVEYRSKYYARAR